MTALVIVMIVIQAALLWVAVAILNQLRRACELLECQAQSSVSAHGGHFYPYTAQAAHIYPRSVQASHIYSYPGRRSAGTGALAIWCWRGTCWELESGSVPAGFESGKPPTYQGSFVGQRVKSECARR